MATSPRRRGSPVSPLRTPSRRPPCCSGRHRGGPSWRTRSQGSGPAGLAASASSLGWCGAMTLRFSGNASPTAWGMTSCRSAWYRGGGVATAGERLGKSTGIAASGWKLLYERFDPAEEGLREALTSTGNGYFCTRGAAEWADADDVHYPGTYTHGGYNRETTIVAGRPVVNEDLVNMPNWLVLKLMIEGEEPVGLGDVELLSYRHELDVRTATVARHLRFRDRAGRETTLASRRFTSMANMHQAAIEWTIIPENWSGRAEVLTALDTKVENRGVARYRQLQDRHLNPITTRLTGPDIISLVAQTRQSRIYVAEAARTRIYKEDELLTPRRSLYRMEDYIHEVLPFEVEEGVPVRVEKMVAFHTSRDNAINEPLG